MGDYSFSVPDVFVEPYAATPQLTARVRIQETTGLVVHAVSLRCQVRIEPQRRRYSESDEAGLRALFGDRERWKDTLRPFLWMQCSAMVPGFTGVTETDLPMPCTYDFEVIGSRYLHAVGEGAVPLSLLFSGTVFTKGETGFGVEQIPWDCDARYDMPVAVWQHLVRAYYPHAGWITMDHDVLDQIADYRARHGLTSWDETMRRLLAADTEASR